jgi:hypothetical protein
MKLSGALLIILAVLAAAAGIAAPIVGNGTALAQLAETNTRSSSAGTMDLLLNQERFINTPDDPYDTGIPVESLRVTVADPSAAAQSPTDGVVVFGTEATLVRTDTQTELSRSGARYAFNGLDSILVDCCGANLNGATEVSFDGLLPLKFPFATEPREYQVFDPQLRISVPVKFDEQVNAYDLDLFRFSSSIAPTQTASVPFSLPASLAAGLIGRLAPDQVDLLPVTGNVDLYEFYAADTTYLVEPVTGHIVETIRNDRISYRLNGGDTDIITKSELSLRSQNPEEIAQAVSVDAAQLQRYQNARPLLLGLGGLLGLTGTVLLVRSRNKTRVTAATTVPLS